MPSRHKCYQQANKKDGAKNILCGDYELDETESIALPDQVQVDSAQLRRVEAETAIACLVLQTIRREIIALHAGPESVFPITFENGEKLRAGLMRTARLASQALKTLRADSR